MDMEIARRLALGRREETRSVRPGRRASRPSDTANDVKHRADYEQYKRQLGIEDGS